MSIGVRTSSLFAASAAVIACLLAAIAPAVQAAFPGRPGLIVFSKVTLDPQSGEGTGGLYAIRPGHRALRQLTTNPRDYSPSFDPTGRKVVFRRVETPPTAPVGGIYTFDLRKGKTRRLTSVGADIDPAFGRKGEIAFSRFYDSSGSYDLVLRSPSGRLRRLTSDEAEDANAVFTPDGERIVFSSIERHAHAVALERADERRAVETKVYSIRTDGSDLQLLTKLREANHLEISPDGRILAFDALKSEPREFAFATWAAELGGGGPSLFSAEGWFPAYSPSGNEIAYTNYQGVWVRPMHGPARRVVTAEYKPMSPGGELVVDPAWQPLP